MPTVTLADLTSRIYSRLDNNTALYTQPEITSAINEVVRVSNVVVGYIQTSVTYETRPNQVWYDVPASILIPLRMQFEQTFLEKFTLSNLGQSAPDWLTETTASTGIPVAHWTTAGMRLFAIHPADSVGGNELYITGVAEPVQLVNPTDRISIPDEFSEMLENMAVVTLVLKEGGKIFADGSIMYQKYMSRLKAFKRFENMRFPIYFVEEAQAK